MEVTKGAYSHEEEVIGLNIILGSEETKSNGHRIRVEPIELVQIMKSL